MDGLDVILSSQALLQHVLLQLGDGVTGLQQAQQTGTHHRMVCFIPPTFVCVSRYLVPITTATSEAAITTAEACMRCTAVLLRNCQGVYVSQGKQADV